MLFEYDNQLYCIRFERNGNSTSAWLDKVITGGQHLDFDRTGLRGNSVCSHLDQFKKSTGRKVALAKLLKRMGEVSAGDTRPEFKMTKEFRTELWNKYFETHRKD